MQGSGVQIALGPFGFLYRYVNSKWLESCKITHNFADRYVDKALQYRRTMMESIKNPTEKAGGTQQPYVLLFGVAEQTADWTELRNVILQVLMAAQENTAPLISNVFFLLSRNQSVWQRLRAEVSTLKDANHDQASLQGMKYLRNVLNESESLNVYCVGS